MRNEVVVNEDMISQLPEGLLLHILSSLPSKDVVATSVLSKQWKSLWKLVPKLKFDYEDIQTEAFSEIVCKVLLSNKAPVIESLHLNLSLENCDAMDIGMCIGMAYARGVRNLVIIVGYETECGRFKFPKSLYNCETLETLELSGWITVHVPSQACLKSLRTLCLSPTEFADEESVVNLLSGCSNLENLELYPGGVNNFTIAVPSLQRLEICHDYGEDKFGGYVINAPSLKYLEIRGMEGRQFCVIQNAPELVEAHIRDVSKIPDENILRSLTSAKRLTLALSPLEIKFPTGSIFCQLVFLELSTHKAEWRNLLLLMLSSSPKLQVLKLIHAQHYYPQHLRKRIHVACGEWSPPKNVPECLLLTLETFVWERYDESLEVEIEVAKYILGNAHRLRGATFSAKPLEDLISQKMVEELESVARASNSCQLMFV